jgi:hypothetical protein
LRASLPVIWQTLGDGDADDEQRRDKAGETGELRGFHDFVRMGFGAARIRRLLHKTFQPSVKAV